MIKIKARSIWHNQVGIREKYLLEAKEKKEGLEIKYQGDVMVIPFEEVETKIVAKSDKPFADNYSNTFHYLIYYKWKPNQPKQAALL